MTQTARKERGCVMSKRKFLVWSDGHTLDITDDTGLAEFFPAPRKVNGVWETPELVIGGREFALDERRIEGETGHRFGDW